MSLKKIWTEGGLGHEWRRGDWYTVGFEGANETAEADRKALYPIRQKYPGATGLFAPFIKHWRCALNGVRPGTALVVVYYEPPTWREILREHPGRGVLSMSTGTDAIDAERVWDKNDDAKDSYMKHQAWRQDFGDKWQLIRWAPVKGDNTLWVSRAAFRLQVTDQYFFFDVIRDLLNSTNKTDMCFAGITAGQLRFAGCNASRELTEDALFHYDIIMEYNEEGWNDYTTIGTWRYYQIDHELLDENGASFDPERKEKVGDWKYTGFEYPVKKMKVRDWSPIDRMIGW